MQSAYLTSGQTIARSACQRCASQLTPCENGQPAIRALAAIVGPPQSLSDWRQRCRSSHGPSRVVTRSAVAERLPAETWDEARIKPLYDQLMHQFRSADLDGNGVIDAYELRNLLETFEDGSDGSASHWLTDEDVSAVMRQYDLDRSGDLNWDEFKPLAQDGALMRGALRDYQAAFNAVDIEGTGGLDVAQLGLLLKELGHPMETSTVQDVFNDFDLDRSGKIEFSEFLRFFRRHFLEFSDILAYLQRAPKAEPTAPSAADAPTPPIRQDAGAVEVRPGEVILIASEQELDTLLAAAKDHLVILEAALTWCRPCKGLQPAYQKLAAHYDSLVWAKFYGNENDHCKYLFKERLKARATPAFFFYRNGDLLHSHAGANKSKLESFVREFAEAEEMNSPLYCETPSETATQAPAE